MHVVKVLFEADFLIRCYTSLNEKEKYVKIAAQISGSEGTEFDERLHFHDQMISTLATIHTKGEQTQLHAEDVLDFVSCTLEKEGPEEQVVPGKQLTFLLVINSRLPRALTCSTIQVFCHTGLSV